MATKKNTGASKAGGVGEFIVLNGHRRELDRHETDFSVMAEPAVLEELQPENLGAISANMARVSASSKTKRDKMMAEVRKRNVAHHIYTLRDTGEELVMDDKVILNLRQEGTGELDRIIDEYKLKYVRRMGSAHVLRLTSETGMNPLKAANKIAERPGVAACSPQLMLDIHFHRVPTLFPEQWYLSTDNLTHPDVLAGVDIDAPLAWQSTKGREEIVLAVIDDGFDLGHPVFQPVRIHPDQRDFMGADTDPSPGASSYHGTPVAGIAVGSHGNGTMCGIAPGCTFLPIRVGFGLSASHIDMLKVFEYVSARADVVNCSFGLSPTSFDAIHPDMRAALAEMAKTGGRRGKGLVMVFSAGNDDAPTFLDGNENVNGVLFTRHHPFGGMVITGIPAGHTVFSGYPMTEGVVVAGAISSLGRKSGYSCWGPHITVGAPSNNMHYIEAFVAPDSDPRRRKFLANYRGLGQVAPVNRPGHGQPFSPIDRFDNPDTPDLVENQYTREFGGTSGAAPVITGVVALVLSANPDLSADQVRNILMATADQDLDATLDLANDPNIQGLSGAFDGGRSLFFGSGKINAAKAVQRALAMACPPETRTPTVTIPVAVAPAPAAYEEELDYDAVQRIKYELWCGDFNVELMAASVEEKIVAEGDSWFDYPPGLDILDQLKRRHGYKIYKVSDAGDTIENMVYGTKIRSNFSRRLPQVEETLNAISRHRPKVVLLSGGGNDLAGPELESFLNHKDSGLPPLRAEYARYMFLVVFKKAYQDILDRIWNIDPSIHIIGHGYGHAIPDGRAVRIIGIRFSGPWLRPALAKKNITSPGEAQDVIRQLIDLFNEMLGELNRDNANFHYLDLRAGITRDDWVNELHLTNQAFGRVADIFAQEIQKYA